MVRYKARQRTSAKAALAHPYFDREGLLVLSFMQKLRLQFFRATQQDYGEAAKWIIQLMAKSGTKKEGGFTEAQLQDLRVCISLSLSLSLSLYIYIYSPAEIFKSKCIFNTLRYSIVQEIQPKGKKKSSPQRNALASALRLQRKVIRTLNESMDELNQRRKSLWWSRWIPREE